MFRKLEPYATREMTVRREGDLTGGDVFVRDLRPVKADFLATCYLTHKFIPLLH